MSSPQEQQQQQGEGNEELEKQLEEMWWLDQRSKHQLRSVANNTCGQIVELVNPIDDGERIDDGFERIDDGGGERIDDGFGLRIDDERERNQFVEAVALALQTNTTLSHLDTRECPWMDAHHAFTIASGIPPHRDIIVTFEQPEAQQAFLIKTMKEHKAAEMAALLEKLETKDADLATSKEKIQQKEARIEELTQQLMMKDDSALGARAGVALNLNIPRSRFVGFEAARDHKGKIIGGAYGTLYTATLGGHRVALKEIKDVHACPRFVDILWAPDNGTKDEEEKRLLREAHILLSCRHPNTVSFLGLSHDAGSNALYFVLSWAEGGSLYDRLHVLWDVAEDVPKLTNLQCVRIAMEVAGAMQFLHAQDIVHRDLKSPNVLLDGSLSAKVTDFGLSAFKKADDKTLTHQTGTLLWASPEQLLKRKLYADTDVFSFGVLYWELCFNCKPWHHGEYAKDEATVGTIENSYRNREYLPVNGEINEVSLSSAQQQLLKGCFDVQGNRLDFSQLHEALREAYKQAKEQQDLIELDEQQEKERAAQRRELLLGLDTTVWKFPPSLLAAVKAVTKEVASRPSVSIAPLDLTQHIDAVKELLTEAGGPTAAQQCDPLKPFNFTLAAVAITHDKQKQAAFKGALDRNKTRYRGHLTSGSSHPFSPKYEHDTSSKEPIDGEQKKVLKRVTCGTVYNLLDSSLLQHDPPLRLQRVFHGVTSWSAVLGILGGDFANLQQMDGGWYGAGFYFTPDLDYAIAYAEPCTDALPAEIAALGVKSKKTYRVVLACDVQYGNPYPVLVGEDNKGNRYPKIQANTTNDKANTFFDRAQTFYNKPLASGHDAHVAVVNFTSGGVLDAKPFTSHKEWSKAGRKPVAEIVMNDPSCVLVRAVLVFEA